MTAPVTERLATFRWAGPFAFSSILEGKAPKKAIDDERDVRSLWNEATAYGLYQVYGTHPIYGSDVLLYVGKAEQQPFARRLRQEGWFLNRDAERVSIYVGRLVGQTPGDNEWSNIIEDAERLLIFSVAPAGNSSAVNSTRTFEPHLRVFHTGNYRDIPAEVSSLRWHHAELASTVAAAAWKGP